MTSGDVESDFVVAPDFKLSDINGDFASFAGGYSGWMIDKKLLVGGGAYTLVNNSGPNGMTYGGGVVEYFVNQDAVVNVLVRGLVGGGEATIGPDLSRFERELDFGFGSIDLDRGRGFERVLPTGFGRLDVDRVLNRFRDRFDVDVDDLEDAFAQTSSFSSPSPR